MMSNWNTKYFLNQRLFLMIMMITWRFSVEGSAGPQQLRGEVGGNLTINCPHEENKEIVLFYFQRDVNSNEKIFVNGYYKPRKMRAYWNNTRVDNGSATVHMYNLNISHSGHYECLIRYKDSQTPTGTQVHISVTAPYSKPEFNVFCSDEPHDAYTCQVTCVSHGGHPSATMMWRVPNYPYWETVNSSETPDRDTKLVTSYSTASFNCSNREVELVRCYVGKVESDPFSVCKREKKPDSLQPYVPVAVVLVALFSIMVCGLVCWKCKKGQRDRVQQEWRPDEESVELNDRR